MKKFRTTKNEQSTSTSHVHSYLLYLSECVPASLDAHIRRSRDIDCGQLVWSLSATTLRQVHELHCSP